MGLITEGKTVVEEIRDSGPWIKDSPCLQFLKEKGGIKLGVSGLYTADGQ